MNQAVPLNSVARLLTEQLVGVLCTAANRQPYGFPMAFVVAGDLRSIVFATYRNTRKYQQLTRNPLVAFVVDNRASLGNFDPSSAELVAVHGVVAEVVDRAERESFCAELVRRYQKLQTFFDSARTAIFKLTVSRYFVVSGIEETTECQIDDTSILG